MQSLDIVERIKEKARENTKIYERGSIWDRIKGINKEILIKKFIFWCEIKILQKWDILREE